MTLTASAGCPVSSSPCFAAPGTPLLEKIARKLIKIDLQHVVVQQLASPRRVAAGPPLNWQRLTMEKALVMLGPVHCHLSRCGAPTWSRADHCSCSNRVRRHIITSDDLSFRSAVHSLRGVDPGDRACAVCTRRTCHY